MIDAKIQTTKDGKKYYRLQVYRGRGLSPYSTRWYIPDGKDGKPLSAREIERRYNKAYEEFKNACENGEVKTRAEAKEEQKLLDQERAKIQTVKQYVERVFMPIKEVECKKNTVSSYTQNLRFHILPELGERLITEIQPKDISALLLKMQKQGLKQASRVKVYNIINGIFGMAYKDDTIGRNPMDKVDRPKASKDEIKEDKVEAYNEAETIHIMQCLKQEPIFWQTLINLMIETGVRRGEAIGLEWKDINFSSSTITIRQNVCYNKMYGVYIDTPKNGKKREISISNEVLNLLKALKIEQKSNVITLYPEDSHKYVFYSPLTNSVINPCSVKTYFARFGKRYGIEHLHPHKLRHTFATISITNGADIPSVSAVLGHSNPSITLKVYSHADEESKKKAQSIFKEALQKAQ